METGDYSFRKKDTVLTAAGCNLWSKVRNQAPNMSYFLERISWNSLIFTWNLWLWQLRDTYYVLGYSLVDDIRRC